MSLVEQIREIAAQIGREHVYRTVYDERLNVLVPGKEDINGEILDTFARIDFAGKSVVDVGCNFGFFTFFAARLGAREVVGVDREAGVLRGCEILKRHFNSPVSFEAHDIEDPCCALLERTYDIAMLVEFIGKTFVLENRIASTLAFLERLSERELIVSVQKVYWIRKELGTSAETLHALYPERYVRDGSFHLLEYVRDFYAPRWRMEPISDMREGYEKPRKLIRFLKM
ncbi:class I SAM-dependent methyltransferase [Desulfolutivibrio sulfoxidireducens]|uniref:class I SAM-dependent methyltransferase n=1 Tax=Desulfolutivibrio sulfoxidireducens TaxID=2773299 RepID=UPI00159D1F3C|nr:methyltransferase domain-containing protein [Desulfolutivibrio sulfoxidireducens]QLA19694.1 methyltransferase domain-containing protein [Desulfolutivibrio sulfoxidireducens]